MTLFFIFSLIFLSLYLPVSSSLTECPSHLPPPAAHSRIINGHTPPSSLSSHLISFHNDGCAGTLLSPTWVLTAGHCLITPSSTAFHAGSTSSNGTPVSIDAVYTHPDYDFPKNDITLVKLSAPVKNAAFIKVNENPAIPALGEFARVVGYGHGDEYGGGNPNSNLFQVDVPIITSKDCQSTYLNLDTGLSVEPQQHICAGYKEGGCDACTQDSGGPLFVYDDQGEKVQIGIVSFGHGCARPNIPGGYLRISKYVKWMKTLGAEFQTSATRQPVYDQGYGPAPSNPDQPLPGGSPGQSGVVTDGGITAGGTPGAGGTTVPSSTGSPASQSGETDNADNNVDDNNAGDEDADNTNENDSDNASESENIPENVSGNTNPVEVVAEAGVNIGAVVGGIVAAAVAIGLVIAIVVWRKWAAMRGSQSGGSGETTEGDSSSGEATSGAENV